MICDFWSVTPIDGFECLCNQCNVSLYPFAIKYVRRFGDDQVMHMVIMESQFNIMVRARRILNELARRLTSDSVDDAANVCVVLNIMNECCFCDNMLKVYNNAAKSTICK